MPPWGSLFFVRIDLIHDVINLPVFMLTLGTKTRQIPRIVKTLYGNKHNSNTTKNMLPVSEFSSKLRLWSHSLVPIMLFLLPLSSLSSRDHRHQIKPMQLFLCLLWSRPFNCWLLISLTIINVCHAQGEMHAEKRLRWMAKVHWSYGGSGWWLDHLASDDLGSSVS